MNGKYYSNYVIGTLRRQMRAHRRNLERRPLFVFSCGGAEDASPPHPARGNLEAFIARSKSPALDNVFCLKAEAIAANRVFDKMDLLTQEAIIADVADWLIIFAESVGSFCELGAFASLPHVQSITSVAVDSRHKGAKSFLIDGPVEVIKRASSPLSKVFYLDLDCPLASAEFTGFVSSIRVAVKDGERLKDNRGRKRLNDSQGFINIGSLVHELLDLVFLMSPINERDLIELYCILKGFDGAGLRIRSRVLTLDMNKGDSVILRTDQAVSFMIASGMVESSGGRDGERLLTSSFLLHDYFMFKSDRSGELEEIRKRVALDKRRDGVGGSFYRGCTM